jgi:Mn2+/Fe2+ NRAMP family transporter
MAKENPASTIFLTAAGNFGEKLFGLVLWSAAITSVVGSSYTTYSFVRTLHPFIRDNKKGFLTLFIAASSVFLMLAGKPVKLLVFAGAFNGIILPFALVIILFIIYKNRKQPYWNKIAWISIPGWITAGGLLYMSYEAIRKLIE